jgi:hypothetical protein
MSLHTLVFTLQPPKTVISGETVGPLRITALPAAGDNLEPVPSGIHVSLEDCPHENGQLDAVAKRLRATAPGCSDAVSDVFYVLRN